MHTHILNQPMTALARQVLRAHVLDLTTTRRARTEHTQNARKYSLLKKTPV